MYNITCGFIGIKSLNYTQVFKCGSLTKLHSNFVENSHNISCINCIKFSRFDAFFHIKTRLAKSILLLNSRHSINVEGRHHISKKQKSKNVSNAPSPVDVRVNEPSSLPPSPPLSSPGNIVPSDPSYGGGPTLNSDDNCIFDVTEYGAVGDGSTDDTDAFVAAWKAACQVESAVVLAPADRTFMITSTIFSGPCKPGLEFRVNGVLMPPEGPDCWPKEDSNKQWLVFYRLDNMSFTGTGTIEGNGEKWWELPCKPHRGPNGSTLPGPCDSPTHFLSNPGMCIKHNGPERHYKRLRQRSSDQDMARRVRLSNRSIIRHNSDGKCAQLYNHRSILLHDKGLSERDVSCLRARHLIPEHQGHLRREVRAIHFACSDTIACTNITMSEVELLPREGELVDDPFCWNAYGIQQTLTIPPIDCLQDGMPQSVGEAVEYTCNT
ncbi:hypothetical protein RND71_008775 [Anisodus tanguticus]|uniref:Polygalacturonase n=1 Tax=Anisodus tanguticus TaxID=243964 RepID=A0AAE1VR10_9SOLA|nr:hypothetical protein RND71_008775 [Anisodus tanguticus]